ncbi:helix-turn-helix domain-containing protein [Paenirhodobacter populi]|uniref:Transcriptional regulator n=1 Tax=Paenirhodobacter populi TaxID=2306993 RepID=A0A443J1A9_9RHOB|nr:helix-turn-helix domain-containing protein [Sinirhodobacter populi]RWR14222.1 transcriptional regulator [Sinirhodobacter populi]
MAKIWSKAQIKCALEERGMTLNGLAELKGIEPSLMRHVWNRTVRSAERALAEYLGVPVAELFPDRYPIRRSRILSAENEALIAREKARRAADRSAAA